MQAYSACHVAVHQHMERAPAPVKRLLEGVRTLTDPCPQFTARVPGGKFILTFGQVLLVLGVVAIILPAPQDVLTIQLTQAAEDERGAVCLDGSTPVIHFSPGRVRNKWLIHHEGGDWCNFADGPPLDDDGKPTQEILKIAPKNGKFRDSWTCTARAQSDLGSSTGRLHNGAAEFAKARGKFEYLSRDRTLNRVMADWNHVYLPYCDGASWAGRATHITRKRVPHQHARDKVYYRGNYILDATIDELLARGMDRADEVVVSGASAGGLAVYMHVDTWAAKIAAAAQRRGRSIPPLVVGLSDGGFFPDNHRWGMGCGFHTRMAQLRILHNITGATSPSLERCFQANSDQRVDNDKEMRSVTKKTKEEMKALKDNGADLMGPACLFAENLLPHVQAPVFATVSAADSWQLKYQLCSTERTEESGIERWAELVRRIATNAVLHPAGYKNGLFLDSCRHHTRCWNQIKIDGLTAAGAFEQWYKHWDRVDRKRLWVQTGGWQEMFEACVGFEKPPRCDITTIHNKDSKDRRNDVWANGAARTFLEQAEKGSTVVSEAAVREVVVPERR